MDLSLEDASSIKAASFLTEFGAVYQYDFDIIQINAATDAADRHF